MPGAEPQTAGSGGSKDFKDRISPAAINRLADVLLEAWEPFPAERFAGPATRGLTGLELKARVVHVADALAATLPAEFPEAAKVLESALESEAFDGWIVYPVDDFVARYGIDYPEISLPLMGRLTSRWSCEFAIRPFIERHPDITFEYFGRWIGSDDEHRRRLVSEGSRPRLPWGGHLRRFREDPAPAIALLDRLVDDPSPYVRKSVANHLNDIARDHPALAIETGRRWLEGGGNPGRRRWIVARGMRSLVKQGVPAALVLLGYDPEAPVTISEFVVEPASIRIGESITIGFSLMAPEPTPAIVDYVVHHAGANGIRSPKVFKLKTVELEPGEQHHFQKRHSIREVSVRRIYPGPHQVEVQVNGRVLASAIVEVTAG
ncbi:MAG: DNA alkylation repair protein [Thermoleophilia bacterium]|nr:DNA alkylation repair protein [Thermoleophilia bacterium]